MIGEGSLVKLVGMEYEYGTGFHKAWQNGLVGTVSKYIKTVNIIDGHVTEACNIDLLVPYLSVKGNPIKFLTHIDVRNLKEVVRIPVTKDK